MAFIDFRKAFDSIDRGKMFQILNAHGIPLEVVDAIKVMYEDTSALVITPEGETNTFSIDTGVLQGDPLAPFLFVICLDYALRSSISDSDGLTLKRRRSRRFPAEVLADLDYADDIALLEDTIATAQDLLNRVEKSCQGIGLFLNVTKTKYMHLNPSTDEQLCSFDGSPIECVTDFKYLCSYTDSEYDMKIRIGLAWSSLYSLYRKYGKHQLREKLKLKYLKLQLKQYFSMVQKHGH